MKQKLVILMIIAATAWTVAQKNTPAPRAEVTASGERTGERSRSFSVTKGGNFEISTSVGEIRIMPWEKNEVHVSVDGIDEEDLDRLKMSQSGNTVRVSFRPRWGDYGHLRFEVNVPSQFNLDMKTSGGDLEISNTLYGTVKGSTSGGDIRIASIGGTLDMNTSGGDITARDVQGDGSLRTSGGDIEVGKVSGELEVSTSGGDIKVSSVAKSLVAKTAGGNIDVGDVGGEVRVSTAGGDIKVGKVAGRASMSTAGGGIELKGATGSVKASTAGGDVRLENITGTIDARTAGGEVEAELIPTGKGSSRLTSAGGDVRLHIPENAKATIEATIRIEERWSRGRDRYKVRSEFKHETYERDEDAEEIRAVYKLNGGGETIYLETVNANIEILKLR